MVIDRSSASVKKGLWFTFVSAVSFGFFPAAAKQAYADGANALFVILFTTFVRAVGLAAFARYQRQALTPPVNYRSAIVRGGFFQALSVFGIIGSLAFLPGPVTIIIMFTHSIMLLFFMAFRGEIKLTYTAILSACGALSGISLVVDLWGSLHGFQAQGVGLAFLGAVATMSRLYVYGKQVQEQYPAAVGAQVFTMAFLFTCSALFFVTPILPLTSTGWLWSVLCALALLLGSLTMFFAIALIGPFEFSLMVKLEPIFTSLFSIVILKEFLTPHQYAGIGIVLLSLIGYQLMEHQNRRKST